MKIAAVVILYYPDTETLANIRSYYDAAEKIYVFDNTEKGCALQEQLKAQPKIAYNNDGKNEGIAKRLNSAAQLAIQEGFGWLLLMDQDSSFAPEMITNYLKCFNEYANKDAVGFFGVNFDENEIPADTSCKTVFSEDLITSGTLLNLSSYPSIGPYDENLFIDGVDHDYTIKTLLAGYQVLQFPNIQLTHTIGAPVKRASIKSLYLVKKDKNLHSPLRCYYIYRNNLYMQKKYEGIKVVDIKKMHRRVKSVIKRNLYYGRNFWKLLYYLAAAKKDFKNNKMGKFSR